MRRVAILGSTGSVGRQALEVIAAEPDLFCVCGLAANKSVELLAEQANRFRPAILSAGSVGACDRLTALLEYQPQVVAHGSDGLAAVALESNADVLLAATDGMSALQAVAASIERGMQVALANKELMVSAGANLCAAARRHGAHIIPVDSEHSALFQCLLGEQASAVASVILTASGGPFWNYSLEQMEAATPQAALEHPTWVMGAKNTIDSATLMNKGLEVIEASRLFDLKPNQIEVVVHRQSIVHGFVIFSDGNVKAQLAAPDMRLPIAFALSYPQRPIQAIGLSKTRAAIGLNGHASSLSFEAVDERRFPALGLAYRALQSGGTYPAVLSAANEEAGRAFLSGQIKFTEICALVQRALDAHTPTADDLEAIEAADRWSRTFTRDMIGDAIRN